MHLHAEDAFELPAFFIEIDRVIREVLSERLGRSVQGLRMEELKGLLGERGLPPGEADRVIALLEECDRARFAPGSVAGDPASLAATLERANELIDFLEKAPLRGQMSADP